MAGAAGTVGDSFSQTIELTVKDIAGVLTIVPTSRTTTAGVWTVAGNVTYYTKDADGAFGGSAVAQVVGNKIEIEVTGELNKDIQWLAHVTMVWVGYRNFVV